MHAHNKTVLILNSDLVVENSNIWKAYNKFCISLILITIDLGMSCSIVHRKSITEESKIIIYFYQTEMGKFCP